MRILVILMITTVLMCFGCRQNIQNHEFSTNMTSTQTIYVETIQHEMEQEKCEEVIYKRKIYESEQLSPNEIRFGNWNEVDWYDNDYFRIIRKYLDAYYQGKIQNENLDAYKELFRSKFAVRFTQVLPYGGLLVSMVFLEMPNIVVNAWVYSYIEDDEIYINLDSVRAVWISKGEESGWTKEKIFKVIQEQPKNKLW